MCVSTKQVKLVRVLSAGLQGKCKTDYRETWWEDAVWVKREITNQFGAESLEQDFLLLLPDGTVFNIYINFSQNDSMILMNKIRPVYGTDIYRGCLVQIQIHISVVVEECVFH